MHIKHLPSSMISEMHFEKEYNDHGDIESILRESKIINDFLKKYAKLRKAYYEGYVDKHSFKHMVTVFLNELPRDPLHYFFNTIPEMPIE